jgi:hypothetical protein
MQGYHVLSAPALVHVPLGPLVRSHVSKTFQPVDYPFEIEYADGQAVKGGMGIEKVGVGHDGKLVVNETFGVAEEGHWTGDGVNSGMVGLAYNQLARGVEGGPLNYTSLVFSL